MAKILKATAGIQFQDRLFRVSSEAGALIDDLLALRGNQIASNDFDTIGRDSHNSMFRLYNEDLGHYLQVDVEGFSYTVDLYDTGGTFEFDPFLKIFDVLWQTIDKRLACRRIRRVGFVTEQRLYKGKDPNRHLLEALTALGRDGFPAKFNLAFEIRKDAGAGGLPDPTKDDFFNFIYNVYDSALDVQHPEPLAVNVNLDAQRYFAPPLIDKSPLEALRAVKASHDRAAKELFAQLEGLGFANAKAA